MKVRMVEKKLDVDDGGEWWIPLMWMFDADEGGEDCDDGGEGRCLMKWIVLLEKEGVS